MLRKHKREGTPLGLKAAEYMNRGDLVPDEVVVEMILQRLKEKEIVESGYVLDGFPRTLSQAQAMVDAGIVPTHFLLLEISDEEVIRRMAGRRVDPVTGATYHTEFRPPPPEVAEGCVQRSDDIDLEAVHNRLKVYHRETESVYIKFKDSLVFIDAAQGSDQASEDCVASIRQ
ncbi:adenylate kinase/UMP-CMP kinase [Kipferlia bialata]|uniref:Adenylate kinase/UMP-CMP kinase n=1 Tax=Kipferlia bialata TaxID=797122 RepID=A0A9K3GIW8_9EUKA|nr:adenylate kinase/UMP-CMP kinase [Kipferlia bialata]|eukprot:g5256.t1